MADARLLRTLSDLFSYPRGDAPSLARRAAALAADAEAGAALGRFAAAAEEAGPTALEELYTATFDLDPACAPYLGVHLLGEEDPARGLLLARLVELYAAEGHAAREELPDHVAEVLAFLAVARPGPDRDGLLAEGLVPALGAMARALGERPNPYREVVAAARALLGRGAAAAASDGAPRARAEVEP